MNPLLSSFCDAIKEASPRWLREARADASVTERMRVPGEEIQPFLDNPRGVLESQGRVVRSNLKLPAGGSHLQSPANWSEAKDVLDSGSRSSDILHAHQNPNAGLEKIVSPAWAAEVTDAARTPLSTYRSMLQPTGPASTFPARVDLYKGLAKIVPKDKIPEQQLLQSAWRGVIPPTLPKFLGNPPAPPPTPLTLGQRLRGLFKKR
jgi:hypothetical protein